MPAATEKQMHIEGGVKGNQFNTIVKLQSNIFVSLHLWCNMHSMQLRSVNLIDDQTSKVRARFEAVDNSATEKNRMKFNVQFLEVETLQV